MMACPDLHLENTAISLCTGASKIFNFFNVLLCFCYSFKAIGPVVKHPPL